MTFCPQCGTERLEGAQFCGKCGLPATATVPAAAPTASPYVSTASTSLANGVSSRIIATFVCAFLVPLVGLILSITGKDKARAEGVTADALNRIAFIYSLILTIIGSIYVVVLIIIAIAAASAASNMGYDY
ncbi:MAG: zinc-ribbon domain [Actinomycetota bacterium]|jgi:uncharacterized membrane protein YvbJ